MKAKALALVSTAMLFTASPAMAAEIITDWEFEAITGGPISSHSGTFSLSFNTITNVYSLAAINFSIGDTIFTLDNASAENLGSGWRIGGNLGGLVFAVIGADDFGLTNNGTFSSFAYTTAGTTSFTGVNNVNGALVLRQVNSAIPEPGTWAMLILGLFGVGAAMRRAPRRQNVTVSYA